MILTHTTNHWSTVINVVLNSYFSHLTTICVVRHKDYVLQGADGVNFNVYLHINPMTLNKSFAKDIYNYRPQEEQWISNGVPYNDWIKKFVAAIENTFCEGFVVFQDDIPKFTATFRKASLYSRWRSTYNRFLFVYSREGQCEDYFRDTFFKDIANILVIEADHTNSTKFSLKTTKFVGSIYDTPQELIKLTTFDVTAKQFDLAADIYSTDKFQNLQGREIIVGVFDYRPFVAVDFQRLPQYYDYAEDNPRHLAHVDGTEMHVLHTFCAIYNCIVQVDTSESDWGVVFPNFTGQGTLGMILEQRIQMALDAMYSWDTMYSVMDQTTFLGRSGITCLVPAPTRIISWTLPLKPFQLTLWLSVAACLLLESLALLLSRYFEQTVVTDTQLNTSWWLSFQFGFITTLKLFVSQSSSYAVKSHTVRTILFACYMIDIIVTSIYGGGLSAILTLPSLSEAADSVERLYKHNLTWSGSTIDWILSIAPRGGEKSDPIYERLSDNFRVFTMDELREKAKTENMGFIVERLEFGHFGNGDFFTPEALDRLKLMIDDIYYTYTVAMVPRLWSLLPKYNDLILLWHSSGFSKYWEWKITAQYMNEHDQEQVEASRHTSTDLGAVALDLRNFGGLVLLWFVGIGLSIVIFGAEWFVYWSQKKRGRRQKSVKEESRN